MNKYVLLALLLLKKTLRFTLKFLLYFAVFILLYLLFGWLLSRIEVDAEKTADKREIPIYIRTSGVHTDLILPVKTNEVDWSEYLPYSNNRVKDSSYRYVAFGWGDKGFYLNTPTWGDLTFSTAFSAAFGLGSSALHVSYYAEVKTNDKTCFLIWITKKQHRKLVAYIRSTLVKSDNGKYIFIPSNAVSGNSDAFYDAKGRYSLFTTCNSWANGGLKAAGQKAALWAPFSGGILCHYAK